MNHIKKNDKVRVMRGKDRGKEGKVLQVMPRLGKVVVEGLNLRFKHRKPRRTGEKGERIQFPAPMDISNVMLICPKCNKPTRVGFEGEKKEKVRKCKKCNSNFK